MFSWFKNGKSHAEAVDVPALTPRDPRTNMFAEAYIITQFRMKLHGALVDLSETGARLRFMTLSGVAVRDQIDIRVPLKNINGKATVVWRDQNEIGIEYDNAMNRSRLNRNIE